MTKLTALLTAAALASLSAAALASSPAAWQQLDQRVARACIAASGLSQAKMIAEKASFSDRVAVELRIIEGYNSQSVIDVKLCAYDRRTGRAATAEGVGRLGVYRN